MRTKMALAVLAASTLAAGNMSAFGGVLKSESTPATSEVQTEEASGAEDEAQTVSIETSEYYFGKINVPYADFYYGEINHVQPEALEDAAAGQYDAEDKVTAAGLREEGIMIPLLLRQARNLSVLKKAILSRMAMEPIF